MATFRTSQPGSAADPGLPHLILVGLPGQQSLANQRSLLAVGQGLHCLKELVIEHPMHWPSARCDQGSDIALRRSAAGKRPVKDVPFCQGAVYPRGKLQRAEIEIGEIDGVCSLP